MTKETRLKTTLIAAAVLGAVASAPALARDPVVHGGVTAVPTPGGNNVVGQNPYGPPGGAIGNPPGAPFVTQDRDREQDRVRDPSARDREAVGGTTGAVGSGQSSDPVYPHDRPGISPAQRGIKTPSYGGNARTPEPPANVGPSTAVEPRSVPTPGGNNVVGQTPYNEPGGAVANPPGAPFVRDSQTGGTAGSAAAGERGSAPGKVETPSAGGNNAGYRR